MKTDGFEVVTIPAEVARGLRMRMTDDVGNPLAVRKDSGRHQCRSCLKLTEPWEGYLAASYATMEGSHPFVERGPIYIHERQCQPYEDRLRYPDEFPRSAVVLRGYGDANEIEDARFVGKSAVEDVIRGLFENPAIRYLHARNATYGCFMFKIERLVSSAGGSA